MHSTALDFLKPVAFSLPPQPDSPVAVSPVASEGAGILVNHLEYFSHQYLADCECVGQSEATVRGKKDVVEKLLWYLRRESKETCTVSDLRAFLIYLQKGHKDPEGRWGCKHYKKPVGQRTVRYYYTYLHGLFKWFVTQGVVQRSLMEGIQRPPDPLPPIYVFTDEQIFALLEAAASSQSPHRDVALILFLLDTGARISEVCSLTNGDLNFSVGMCEVMGKGKKRRTLHFVKETGTALCHYLVQRYGSMEKVKPSDPLFVNQRRTSGTYPLTRSGALQLIQRLGKTAGIEGMRCSPHTFRHAFATKFSAADGPSTTLQTLLGHSTLYMTSRYVHLAQADIREQHRRFSPVVSLMEGVRKL